MDKIKVYVVDGVRYNVGPNREQEFLGKFPNAKFIEEKQKEGKEKAVANQGASVTAQSAPTTELPSVASSLDSAYDLPEKLKLSTEEKETARERYIEEANADPVEEYVNMSFAEYRESGLIPPGEEKYYAGSGTKRVKVKKNVYDPFIEQAKKEVGEDNELEVIQKAKSLYVENKLQNDRFQKVEDYLRDEAGIFTDDVRTFRNLQTKNIGELQKEIESDIEANYNSFVKINGEISNIIKEAQKIKSATYTTEEERIQAKNRFIELRETANTLSEAAAKRHEAIMSSEQTYADNARFLDIFKREYTDAGVLAGGLVSSAAGIAGGLLKLPEWLFVTAASAFDKEKEARIGWQMYTKGTPAAAGDVLLNFSESMRGKIAMPLDVSEINSLSDAGSWVADLIGNQLPIIGTMVATGGSAGLGLVAASTAGQKYEDMAKEIDLSLSDYNTGQLLFAPAAVATGEFITERLTTIPQLRAVKKVFKKSPDVLKASKEYIANNILKPKFLVDVSGESLGEGLATLNENVVDVFFLDKQKSLWEGVPNAMVSGAFMSGVVFKAPVIGARMLSPFTDTQEMSNRVNSNLNQIAALEKALENEELDQDDKTEIQKNIDTLHEDNLKTLKKSYESLDNFTPSEIKELIALDVLKNETRSKYLKIKDLDTEEAKETIKELDNQYGEAAAKKRTIIRKAEQRLVPTKKEKKKLIDEDFENLRKLSKQLGHKEPLLFKNSEEAAKWLVINYRPIKGNVAEARRLGESSGLFLPELNQSIVNLNNWETATGSTTTATHEGLHAFLDQVHRSNPDFVVDIGKKLLSFVVTNVDPNILESTRFGQQIQKYRQDPQYTGVLESEAGRAERKAAGVEDATVRTQANFYSEVLTILSEEIASGRLKFKEDVFTKLGDTFRLVGQTAGMPIKFETGRDVYNFVKDYTKSYKKGKLTKSQAEFAAGKTAPKPKTTQEAAEGPQAMPSMDTTTDSKWKTVAKSRAGTEVSEGITKELEFKVGNVSYTATAIILPKKGNIKELQLTFEDELGSMLITGAATRGDTNAFKVLSIVGNSTVDLVIDQDVNYVRFSGEGASRQDVYDTLGELFSNRLQQRTGKSWYSETTEVYNEKDGLRGEFVVARDFDEAEIQSMLEDGENLFDEFDDFDGIGALSSLPEDSPFQPRPDDPTYVMPPRKTDQLSVEENERLANLLKDKGADRFANSSDPALVRVMEIAIAKSFQLYWNKIPENLKQGFVDDDFRIEVEMMLRQKFIPKWQPNRADFIRYMMNMPFRDTSGGPASIANKHFGIQRADAGITGTVDIDANRGFSDDMGFDPSNDDFDIDSGNQFEMIEDEGAVPGVVAEEKVIEKFSDKLPVDYKFQGKSIGDIVKEKLERSVKLSTTKLSQEISNNVTVKTPFIDSIKNDMKDELQQAFVSMIMNYEGGLNKFLADNRIVIINNLETSYMLKQGLLKLGVQKSYKGRTTKDRLGRPIKEPNWITATRVSRDKIEFLDPDTGKVIPTRGTKDQPSFDRQSGVRSGRKGITSGLIFKRRHPDVNKLITEADFIDYFYRDRGQQFVNSAAVDALARQLAMEYSLEVLAQDFKQKGELYKTLEDVADIRDIAMAATANEMLAKDIERGDAKRSVTENGAMYNLDPAEDLFSLVLTEIVSPGLIGQMQREMFPEMSPADIERFTGEVKRKIAEVVPDDHFSLSEDSLTRLDEMLLDKRGIPLRELSENQLKNLAADNKRRNSRIKYVPPKFDDFWGLMYYLVRKGKVGEQDIKWIEKNIMDPYVRGHIAYVNYRQSVVKNHDKIMKTLRKEKGKLNLRKRNEDGYTNEESLRALIWSRMVDENGIPIVVPGFNSRTEIALAANSARRNPALRSLADQLTNLFAGEGGYPLPTDNWRDKNISKDIIEHLNEVKRPEFMAEFIEKSTLAFGTVDQAGNLNGEFANKLEAAFGRDYVEALADMLYRMRVGRTRKFGTDKDASRVLQYINNATATVMFANTRSALLQMMSTFNYLNTPDNNIFEAGVAFANQKQYWQDVKFIFESDYLKARRGGMTLDIRAEEVIEIAEAEGFKTFRGGISKILQKGFLPTQYADSFAISLGGAMFYRNRLNSYIKDGMTEEDAKDQAFKDFVELTEESQQSSRQDRLSKIQVSAVGRIFFAFGNTPLQYSRIIRKAFSDIYNRRGSDSKNLGKILYYGTIQNFIFSAIQNALIYSIFGGADEDDKEEIPDKTIQAINSSVNTLLRASGWGGLLAATLKDVGVELYNQSNKPRADYDKAVERVLSVSPPIGSRIGKMYRAAREVQYGGGIKGIKQEGVSWTNPAISSAALVVESMTNAPAARLYEKVSNLALMAEDDVTQAQALYLAVGFRPYNVNVEDFKQRNRKKGKSKSRLRKKKIK